MNDKGIGAIFCLIAAVLISAKYIAAAMFVSGGSWGADIFATGLESVGPFLTIVSFGALVVGILFMGHGIYQDIKNK